MTNTKLRQIFILNFFFLAMGKTALGSDVKPIAELFPTQARYAGDGAYFACTGDVSAQIRLFGPAGKRSEVLALENQLYPIYPVFTKSVPVVFAFDRAGNFGLKFDGKLLHISDGLGSSILKCDYVFVNK